MLLLFFVFILFKAFLRAEIDRLSVDLRPAGIADGNIGVAEGVLHKILTGGGSQFRRTGLSPHPRKGFPEKSEQKIKDDDADHQPEYHFSTFIFDHTPRDISAAKDFLSFSRNLANCHSRPLSSTGRE
jgi:hypothetical protein